MSAQDILIAHGEKALVLLVTAACGYGLYGTFNNPEIRTALSMEQINEMVAKVEKVRGEAAPPVMKAPSNYLDDMVARLAVQLPSSKYYAVLSAALDVGPTDHHSSQYYIYEIHPPKLSVVDNIGNLDLTVELPASQRTADVRISDAPSKTWALQGRDDNKAQWLGVQLEFRVGAADWQPLIAKEVKNGLLTFKEGSTSYTLTVQTVEPWQRHHFRARLFAKATGLPLDTKKSSDQQQTILVSAGTYQDENLDWAKLQADIKDVVDGKKEVLDRFQNGVKQGPFSEQLRGGELLYRSVDSDEATLIATDSIRFVFDKVNQNPGNPEQNGATFLLSKFLRDPRAVGEKKTGRWMPKPKMYKLLPGDALGNPEEKINDIFGKNPNQVVPENLSTPYVLTSVKDKVKRVLYYEILTQSRAMGGRDKDLDVKPKEIETEVAILTNSKTGAELQVPRCERVIKPNKPLSVFYPDYLVQTYDEAAEFQKNPAGFKQNQLVPKPPVKYDPDMGPLEDLRKRRNDPLLKTATPYYELPDGRIVYWEENNHKLITLIKPGSEAAADKEAADKAEKEAADKAAAEAAAAKAAEAAKAGEGKDKAAKEPKEVPKDPKEAPKPAPK